VSRAGAEAGGHPLTVVVATRDRPDHLDACLTALAASVGPDDQIVVVDSASSSAEPARVAHNHGVRLVRQERAGASRARNAGWRAARTEVVAFVDDDVRVDASWADALRNSFSVHPGTSFLTGRLSLSADDLGTERPVAFLDRAESCAIDVDTVDDLGHGANLAVRRTALEVVGGYDERLGPGTPWPAAEDLELIDRLVLAGYLGRYEPTAVARHVQWRRRRHWPGLEWRYGLGQGARLARLRSAHRRRYRALSRSVWKERGTVELAGCLRRREELGAVLVLCRLSGTALGQLTATVAGLRARSVS
jgi:GT2 family glycosyltransferase